MKIDLGTPSVIGPSMRAAVKQYEGCVSYGVHVRTHFDQYNDLMLGHYDEWDTWDLWDEEDYGIDVAALPATWRDPHLGVIS